MIESVNNERVKYWSKLNDKKYQIREGMFLVEGEHAIQEAMKRGSLLEVLLLKGERVDFEKITYVSEPIMRKVSSLSSIPKMIGVVKMIEPRDVRGNVLLLDGIQDPGNMGTIIRSAVAFGIDSVILGDGCVSVYNPKVLRATEGNIFHINIITCELSAIIHELRSDGYTIYSTRVDGGMPLRNVEFTEKSAIIMGSEGAGVDGRISELCDEYLYIPMGSSCESLNVGVATSIILYELAK